MAKYEAEELLHALAAGTAEGEGGAPLDEAQLRAYRAGELDAEEASRIEALLTESRQARATLVALAGIDTASSARGSFGSEPPAAIREQVLSQFDQRPVDPRQSGPQQVDRRQGSSRHSSSTPVRKGRLLRALLPAAIFVSLVFGVQVFNRSVRELPVTEIDVSNASAVRSGPSATFQGNDRFKGLADDRVKIRVRPTRDAVPGVEYGLYRRIGDAVERIDDEPWVRRVDANESSELLVESAAALVSDRAWSTVASNTVASSAVAWTVAAWHGELPDEILVPPGSDDQAVLDLLTDGGRRRVHPITIEIVPQ